MQWTDFLVAFVFWQVVAGVGISAGLHRYFAHRQFEVPVWMEYVFLTLSTLAGARSPIGWIGAHRMHHNHSDGDLDPHSPKTKGFWTVLFNQWDLKTIDRKYVKELFDNPRLVLFHERWPAIWISFAFVTLLIHWKLFVIFVLIPALLGFIGFGWVNAVCHIGGKSRNVMWVNLLVGGEGYHDEHHKNGKRIRMGKYDHTGFIIEKLLSFRQS